MNYSYIFSFCEAPASVAPYVWPDDITKWPICRKRKEHADTPPSEAEHMVCEVIGHPCCIGIRGQCQITTKEFCDFVKGVYHDEAALCSQVSKHKQLLQTFTFKSWQQNYALRGSTVQFSLSSTVFHFYTFPELDWHETLNIMQSVPLWNALKYFSPEVLNIFLGELYGRCVWLVTIQTEGCSWPVLQNLDLVVFACRVIFLDISVLMFYQIDFISISWWQK